jgi:hypothetical protein
MLASATTKYEDFHLKTVSLVPNNSLGYLSYDAAANAPT